MARALTTDIPLPARPVLRLTGSVGHRQLSFVVEGNENLVGSSASCDLALRVPGVSQRHASIRLDGNVLVVEDLASRNGTFVNGIAIQRRTLEPGDEVSFGPVTFRLEVVDADDVELGLVADTFAPAVKQEETEWLLHPQLELGGWGPVRRMTLLLLGRTNPDIADALRLLADSVSAAGGAIGEWSGVGEPAIFATAGDVGTNLEHPAVVDFLGTVFREGESRPCFRAGRILTDPPLSCCGFRRPGLKLLAIVLRGRELRPGWQEGGEILLRLLDQARAGNRQQEPAGGPDLPTLAISLSFLRAMSAPMRKVYEQLQDLCKADIPVLVRGETGVGKEHLVRLLHEASGRRRSPFVAINCAAIPAELLEAEMFGIGRGVASGVAERQGRFREANGGTLFLDEIGEMPLPLQTKLLRALDSGTIQPLGGGAEVVDVRVVSATNADLERRIAEGRFRADLYYRLAAFELEVPPLRQRREDIPPLIQHFLGRFSLEARRQVRGVSVSALRLLTSYSWPGNVRELQNEVYRLVLACHDGTAITSTSLKPAFQATASSDPTRLQVPLDLTLETRVEELETALIREAMRRTDGSQRSAAQLLGISRNGLAAKMSRLGIASWKLVE
ncbi:MAG TPA: sigma 54-interacting transcriptional regulator [Thermoanaerobaculia bacterium]|nr:sigma 54-interacting transcriptional regulator [Thermoanaerobaculia bacterium]